MKKIGYHNLAWQVSIHLRNVETRVEMRIKMSKRFLRKYILLALAVICFLGIIMLVVYNDIVHKRRNEADVKSQYTFQVRFDKNVSRVRDVIQPSSVPQGSIEENWLESVSLVDVSRLWMQEYLNQLKGPYVPTIQSIRFGEITDINVINADDKTVLLEFNAKALDTDSEYFSSWEGYIVDNTMMCEWVIKFEFEDLYDGTAIAHAVSIQMPEEYGIETYASAKNQEKVTVSQTNTEIYRYQLNSDRVQVTFDGGEHWVNVPVDSAYLTYSYSSAEDKTGNRAIDEGRYIINADIAAFVYGGIVAEDKEIPLTLVFTKDKGENWVSSQISDIKSVQYGYITYFSDTEGIMVASYRKSAKDIVTVIYKTVDGGEMWTEVCTVTNSTGVTDVNFINGKTGFVCFEYSDSMKNTLFATYDGGMSLTEIVLPQQQLSDNANGKYKWNEVFVQASAPAVSDNGRLVVTLSQNENTDYPNATMAARYYSEDEGKSWSYLDQIDLNVAGK